MIFYVERDDEGKIFAVYTSMQPGKAEEFLGSDNQELIDFLEFLKG